MKKMKDKQILEELLDELKKLNKHLDKIEAEKMGEMIFNRLEAREPVPERLLTWEEVKELARKGLD